MHPAWSPDHTRIAFIRVSRNGLSYTLWTMLANGGGQRQLTHGTSVAAEPAWSPNGKTIVFRGSSNGGRTFDLYTIAGGRRDTEEHHPKRQRTSARSTPTGRRTGG